MEGDAYIPEYVAPVHSIVSREVVGRKVITTVILEGALVEFEWRLCDALAEKDRRRNDSE